MLRKAKETKLKLIQESNERLMNEYSWEEESPLEESGDISNGIAFGSAINLTYTDPASGYTHKINGLASASIGKVNTVATGSIGKINTVD